MPPTFAPWWCCEHGAEFETRGDGLHCPAGAHHVPIRDGIPRFVDGSNYADAFGNQWKTYRLTQLDSYTGTSISRDRLRRNLGEELWGRLSGTRVLECGCGAGRFTEVLLDEGAQVTSVDLSEAVEANADSFPPSESHRVAQADIAALPLAPRQFDVVLCLGVVQHTPRPERTIAALYKQVAPGGSLVFDHYTYSLPRMTRITVPIARTWLLRQPTERQLAFTTRLVDRLLPLHRRSGRLALVVRRVSPITSYYHVYPELPDRLRREWALLDTHDSLTAVYKRMRTSGQLRRTLERLEATDVVCVRAGNGIEVRARRPVTTPPRRASDGHARGD
jgi:SAM-dependent methyltransferase